MTATTQVRDLIKLEDFADEFYDSDLDGNENVDLTWRLSSIAANDIAVLFEEDERLANFRDLTLEAIYFQVIQWTFSVGRLELDVSNEVMEATFTTWFHYLTTARVIDSLLFDQHAEVTKEKLDQWFNTSVNGVVL